MELKSLRLFLQFAVAALLLSCGGGGGAPDEADISRVLENDLDSLSNDQYKLKNISASSIDSQLKFEQVFGTQMDPVAFVKKRLRFPFNDKNLSQVLIVDKSGTYGSVSLGSLADKDKKSKTRLATNYGTFLWKWSQEMQATLEVRYLDKKMSLNTPRVGLIGFTSRFFNNYVANSAPRESRMALYIHEGRHSDCSGIDDGFTCGYGHVECPSYHDLAGVDACDDGTWGAYAVGAVYLDYVKNQFAEYSQEYRFLKALAVDSYSRLSDQALSNLEVEEPDLTSL